MRFAVFASLIHVSCSPNPPSSIFSSSARKTSNLKAGLELPQSPMPRILSLSDLYGSSLGTPLARQTQSSCHTTSDSIFMYDCWQLLCLTSTSSPLPTSGKGDKKAQVLPPLELMRVYTRQVLVHRWASSHWLHLITILKPQGSLLLFIYSFIKPCPEQVERTALGSS